MSFADIVVIINMQHGVVLDNGHMGGEAKLIANKFKHDTLHKNSSFFMLPIINTTGVKTVVLLSSGLLNSCCAV